MAGDRLLEARELDDDEAVEFLRALEDPELAALRANRGTLGIVAARFAIVSGEQFGTYRTVFD